MAEPIQSKCPNCGRDNLCQNLIETTEKNSPKVIPEADSCWCMSVKLTSKQREEIAKFSGLECCLCSQCIDSFK